jgi:hypothetical protein
MMSSGKSRGYMAKAILFVAPFMLSAFMHYYLVECLFEHTYRILV